VSDVHPATRLTEVVHQRTRLGILSVLAECGRADFGYLKSLLQLTDGNLGRHLEVLAEEDLVTITKGYEGRRPRTWAQITKAGEDALGAQMAAMKQLVAQFEARTKGTKVKERRNAVGQNAGPRLAGA
jgi:DNA-binding PadR family transcriptional regulator